MNDLILYTTEDGRSQIKLRAARQTVWLSQREIAELFDVSVDNVGLHLKNIYQDGELIRKATAEESSVVQIEGNRQETRMSFWKQNVDQIITSNRFPLLNHAGSVSRAQMKKQTSALYLQYDRQRKTEAAKEADLQDEAELKTLEAKIKRRNQ